MKAKHRIILSALVLTSALLCWFAASLQAGYADSPGDTHDSGGHPLGFLNPVTGGLCAIMLRNATLPTTLDMLGWYGGLYLWAHLIALVAFAIDLAGRARRAMAIASWLQLVLFPTCWLTLFFLLPHVAANFFAGKIDGETISDIPFWWTFQPLWLAISALTGILLWQQSDCTEQGKAVSVSESFASPRLRGS